MVRISFIPFILEIGNQAPTHELIWHLLYIHRQDRKEDLRHPPLHFLVSYMLLYVSPTAELYIKANWSPYPPPPRICLSLMIKPLFSWSDSKLANVLGKTYQLILHPSPTSISIWYQNVAILPFTKSLVYPFLRLHLYSHSPEPHYLIPGQKGPT